MDTGAWRMTYLSLSAQILGPVFGWADLFEHRPKLGAYFAAMQADPEGARVGCPAHAGSSVHCPTPLFMFRLGCEAGYVACMLQRHVKK